MGQLAVDAEEEGQKKGRSKAGKGGQVQEIFQKQLLYSGANFFPEALRW